MDLEDKLFFQSGKVMWVDSTVYAKLLTFREGVLVAVALRWIMTHSFLFELDSKFIVAWIADRSSIPW